jgi:hypothetical protein
MIGVTTTARNSLALGVALAVLGACGGSKSTTSAAASDAPTRLKVTCPARPASVKPDSQATLTVVLKSDPPLAAGADVNLRLYEETAQSTHKLNPVEPSPFTLRAGVYVLRVTTKGYRTVEGQANLTAGCEITMTLDLRPSK